MRVLFVLRRKAGLTQLELATEVGVSQGEISNAEGGFRIRRLDKIAERLHVKDADDLLMDWDDYRDRNRAAEAVA